MVLIKVDQTYAIRVFFFPHELSSAANNLTKTLVGGKGI